MKPLRRMLSFAPTIVTLLLFISVASMWTRSYLWGDAIDFTRGPAVLQIRSGAGCLALQSNPNWGKNPQGSLRRWTLAKPEPYDVKNAGSHGIAEGWLFPTFWDQWGWDPHHQFHFAGFTLSWASGLFVQNYAGSQTFWVIETPYWFWLFVIALVPAARILRRRARKNKSKKGHCPTCGYDLRATPERCPECGTPVPPKVVSSPQ